jgi:hypothetical protein
MNFTPSPVADANAMWTVLRGKRQIDRLSCRNQRAQRVNFNVPLPAFDPLHPEPHRRKGGLLTGRLVSALDARGDPAFRVAGSAPTAHPPRPTCHQLSSESAAEVGDHHLDRFYFGRRSLRGSETANTSACG